MHFKINDLAFQVSRIDFITDTRDLAGSIAVIADEKPDADGVRDRLRGDAQETYRLICQRNEPEATRTTNPEIALRHLASLCTSYADHTAVGYVNDLPSVILPPGHLRQITPNGLPR